MRFLSLVLVALPLIQPVISDSLEQVCTSIKGISSCNAFLTIPDGITHKYCDVVVPQPNPCKSKIKWHQPCGKWYAPKMCEAWTCVPGTDGVTVQRPCDFSIKYKRINLCDVVRSNIGHIFNEVVDKTTAMCSCGPDAIKLLSEGLFDAVKAGDISQGVTNLVGQLVRVQKCFIDRGFKVQETKQQVRESGALSDEGGWIVFEAAEIDLQTYGELIGAIAPCFYGACNPISFFTNYINRSKKTMGDQIEKHLHSWISIFDTIITRAKNVEAAIVDLFAHLKTVPDKVEKIRLRICANGACTGPTITSFIEKISEAIATATALEEITDSITDLDRDIPKMTKTIRTIMNTVNDIPDTAYFINLIASGNFTKVTDMISAFKIATELPKLGQEIQKDVSTILKGVTTFGSRANQTLELFTDIISTNWESYPLEFTTDASGSVRAGLLEMQNLIRDEITAPLQNVTKTFKTLEQGFRILPFKQGYFYSKAGVASYQRWNDFSFKMPCSTTGQQTFSFAGFTRKVPYPKFYACDYKDVLRWPNHHIPYVKFRVT
ncbi:hypothetical protein B0J11DRAFT_510670 [Dendryphion nanum]|uniref:Uncharacterized protein n=1 Tax=Dendryphion nanum TaxID=256645 RepID=A0A9P9D9V4_9PLEO|nr:hypothetical protein B0J11DRAFT_510670 [Dendryphion nanum]